QQGSRSPRTAAALPVPGAKAARKSPWQQEAGRRADRRTARGTSATRAAAAPRRARSRRGARGAAAPPPARVPGARRSRVRRLLLARSGGKAPVHSSVSIDVSSDPEPHSYMLGAPHEEQRAARLFEQTLKHGRPAPGERAMPAQGEHARRALFHHSQQLGRRIAAADQHFLDRALLAKPAVHHLDQAARKLMM